MSVVVVTSRSHLLGDLLATLQHQTWIRREIVLVCRQDLPLKATLRGEARCVLVQEDGLGTARQAGVQAAEGDIIAFTDDDCLPDGNWLTAIVDAFEKNPDLWGVQGRTEAEPGPIGSYTVQVSGPDSLYQTCNIAYRRAAIDRVGGFDGRFEGWFEDTALGARIAAHGPIGFRRDALVRHRAMPRIQRDRSTWRRVLLDERRLARAYPEFYRRTRGPGFMAAVIIHWLAGSPLKALTQELPRSLKEPRQYLRFAQLLAKERIELVQALLDVVLSGAT